MDLNPRNFWVVESVGGERRDYCIPKFLKVGGVNQDQSSLKVRYLHHLGNLCTKRSKAKVLSKAKNWKACN